MNDGVELLFSIRSKAWHALAVLTVVYFIVTAWNLDVQHIVSPDEPRYAASTRDMMRDNEFVVPFFNMHPHLEKPVLFHWLLMVSATVSRFLGISLDTAGFRFVPLFMGWFAVLGIYLLGRRLLNARGAFIAAVILMTSLWFHDTARELVIDMTLTTFLLWSWLFFHIALGRLERREPCLGVLLGFYLCLGFACMSKGPFLVGIFSIVPVLIYLAWTRRLPLLLRAGIWWGLPLSVVMGLSWFVALKLKGYDNTDFFAVENLARFFGRKDHIHLIPFFYYIISLPEIFAPWFVLLPFAAWWSFKTYRRDKASPDGIGDSAKMAACALGISFIVMGTSISKRHLYLLPLFPHMALWLAWFLERTFVSIEGLPASAVFANCLRAGGVVLFAACASSILWLPRLGAVPVEITLTVLIGALSLIALASAASALKRGNRPVSMYRILAVALFLAFGLESVRRPVHERALNLEEFYTGVREKLAGRPLVMMGTNSNEASWYIGNASGPIDEISEHELKARFFESPRTALLVAVPFLQKSPVLKDNVVNITPEKFFRNGVPFMLVEPDTSHPINPIVYQAHVRQPKAGLFDDL